MADNRVMVLGEKETFIIRILMKKMNDAGIGCEFVPMTVNDINAKWKDCSLITIYMDEEAKAGKDILHFLVDKATEDGKLMIALGEEENVRYVCDHVPGELLYKTFVRPVDNEKYINTVREIFDKTEAGEFRKSVLIVDDDPSYMGLVREWLKGTYKVSMANSGLQALKWLGKNKADLILLDYEMPVTSGPQVLEMLRSDEETKDIPVIFLTGKGDKESVMAVVALKPQGYFLKNIEREELLEKMKEFFILHKQNR